MLNVEDYKWLETVVSEAFDGKNKIRKMPSHLRRPINQALWNLRNVTALEFAAHAVLSTDDRITEDFINWLYDKSASIKRPKHRWLAPINYVPEQQGKIVGPTYNSEKFDEMNKRMAEILELLISKFSIPLDPPITVSVAKDDLTIMTVPFLI